MKTLKIRNVVLGEGAPKIIVPVVDKTKDASYHHRVYHNVFCSMEAKSIRYCLNQAAGGYHSMFCWSFASTTISKERLQVQKNQGSKRKKKRSETEQITQ